MITISREPEPRRDEVSLTSMNPRQGDVWMSNGGNLYLILGGGYCVIISAGGNIDPDRGSTSSFISVWTKVNLHIEVKACVSQ